MKTTRFRRSETGFSIIEIMIAMLIGIFLLGGLMQMFVSSKQTYKLQDAMSRLQENGRFAMDFLTRDIRGTGSWGCFSNTVSVTSLLNPGGVFDGFATGIQGENNHVSTGTADKVLAGTDVISLRSTATLVDANGNDVVVKDIPSTTSADLKVSKDSTIADGDILFISDCSDGNVFQATNVNTAGNFDNLVHNTGGTVKPGNASKEFTKIYGNDARLYTAKFIRYEIRIGEGGQPALFKTENEGNAQEFIEGVEDMQIEYGEDIDADGTPNRYQTADKVGNWGQVVSVKITLLVRSVEDNLANAPVAYTYNGTTVTPTDKRIRRIFSSVIAVRNRLI
jgi:type IV pilus assembly protein PilW